MDQKQITSLPSNSNQNKFPSETYKELQVQDKAYIEDIVSQLRGPYQPFKKRVKLQDLVQLLNEIWEEDED